MFRCEVSPYIFTSCAVFWRTRRENQNVNKHDRKQRSQHKHWETQVQAQWLKIMFWSSCFVLKVSKYLSFMLCKMFLFFNFKQPKKTYNFTHFILITQWVVWVKTCCYFRWLTEVNQPWQVAYHFVSGPIYKIVETHWVQPGSEAEF